VLILAVALAYAPTLGNGLVWDDVPHIADNPRLHDVGAAGTYLFHPEGAYYRPIVFLAFAAEHAAWGTAAVGYHVINLLLHIVNTLLVLWLARRTGVAPHAALFGAALFGLHPLQSEAVAYVSGRTDLLMTTGALLSWAALLRPWSAVARGGAAAAAGALAMLSKESGYALVLLWIWWGWRHGRSNAERIALIAPGVGIAVVLLALRPGALPPLAIASTPARLAGVGQALFTYVALVIWPRPLLIDRLTVLPQTPAAIAFGPVALLSAIGCAAYGLSRRGAAADWTAWTVAFYLPVANLIALYPALADRALFTPEHNLYAPLAGVGMLVARSAERAAARGPLRVRRAVLASLFLLAFTWASLTAARCAVWHDEERLFGAAVAAGAASPRVWFNYGNVLLQRGAIDPAAEAFEGAAQRGPRDADIWTNLGVARQRQRSYDAAEHAYRRAAELAPQDARIAENLGTLYLARGDIAAARAAFLQAVRLDPERATAQRALAAIGR
jgi:hypothetical protein